MISADLDAIGVALGKIRAQFGTENESLYSCPGCGMTGLSEDGLWHHYPLYHSCQPNIDATCPICDITCVAHRGGPDVHIHNNHGPVEGREPVQPRFAAFAWVVCTNAEGRFLMVHEPAGLA